MAIKYFKGDLTKETKLVIQASGKLQTRIHALLLGMLDHAARSGDVRPFFQLADGLKAGSQRVNGMMKWIETYAPVKQVETEEGIRFEVDKDRLNALKKNLTGAIERANANPFWKFKAEEGTPYKPMDVKQAVGQLIRRLETDQKNLDGVDHSAKILLLKEMAA